MGKIRFKHGAEVSTLLRPHYPHLILGIILPIDTTDTCGLKTEGEGEEKTAHRLWPCWQHLIAPWIRQNQNVLIVAHGDSMRALIKHRDSISDGVISEVEIPMGVPLIYNVNANLVTLEKYYLRSSARSITTGVPTSAEEIAVH